MAILSRVLAQLAQHYARGGQAAFAFPERMHKDQLGVHLGPGTGDLDIIRE